jgi:hypothetical protein
MKHSRGTYSAVNITALMFGAETLPVSSFQKLSSSQHAYTVSVTSKYPSTATMNSSVPGYLWNTQDIISSITRTNESE